MKDNAIKKFVLETLGFDDHCCYLIEKLQDEFDVNVDKNNLMASVYENFSCTAHCTIINLYKDIIKKTCKDCGINKITNDIMDLFNYSLFEVKVYFNGEFYRSKEDLYKAVKKYADTTYLTNVTARTNEIEYIRGIIEKSNLVKQYAYKEDPCSVIVFYSEYSKTIQCQIVVSLDIKKDQSDAYENLCSEIEKTHNLSSSYIHDCGKHVIVRLDIFPRK